MEEFNPERRTPDASIPSARSLVAMLDSADSLVQLRREQRRQIHEVAARYVHEGPSALETPLPAETRADILSGELVPAVSGFQELEAFREFIESSAVAIPRCADPSRTRRKHAALYFYCMLNDPVERICMQVGVPLATILGWMSREKWSSIREQFAGELQRRQEDMVKEYVSRRRLLAVSQQARSAHAIRSRADSLLGELVEKSEKPLEEGETRPERSVRDISEEAFALERIGKAQKSAADIEARALGMDAPIQGAQKVVINNSVTAGPERPASIMKGVRPIRVVDAELVEEAEDGQD